MPSRFIAQMSERVAGGPLVRRYSSRLMSGNHAGWLDCVPSGAFGMSVIRGRPVTASRTLKSTIEISNWLLRRLR